MSAVTLKIKPVAFEAHMSYDITDAEPLPVSYSRQGRLYQPNLLVLHYRRGDGGPWKYESGQVFGQVLKKDGAPSQNRHSQSLWRHDSDWWPTWLKVAIGNVPEQEAS